MSRNFGINYQTFLITYLLTYLLTYSHTYLLTYLLTYSMVHSPSWEANWFAASQEISRISRNPKVDYRTHKRSPPISILGQPNPVHIPTTHLLEIELNIIHPSTPRSLHWSPSLRFPHQDPIHPFSSPIRATCPAQLILLDFIARTINYQTTLCNNKELLCITHTVEHNYISASSTVGIQLHDSALYVGHLQVVI